MDSWLSPPPHVTSPSLGGERTTLEGGNEETILGESRGGESISGLAHMNCKYPLPLPCPSHPTVDTAEREKGAVGLWACGPVGPASAASRDHEGFGSHESVFLERTARSSTLHLELGVQALEL